MIKAGVRFQSPMFRAGPIAAFLVAFFLAGAAQAQTAEAVNPRGHAYLFRGLIGAIDWGMDQLAARINKSGVTATIDGYQTWRSAADQAIADYRRQPAPITVIGHSIGGDSAVQFAERLAGAHVPVALMITYDPTRMAGRVPGNVERYINLYQSSNFLGGGDLTQGSGFHGNYASFNLKDRAEIIHVNLDKFDGIQAQLAAKVRALPGVSAREGEAVPLRLVPPASGPLELWDSGTPVTAHAGDTLQSIATQYHVPLWAVVQLNSKSEHGTLNEGERIIIPRFLGRSVQAH